MHDLMHDSCCKGDGLSAKSRDNCSQANDLCDILLCVVTAVSDHETARLCRVRHYVAATMTLRGHLRPSYPRRQDSAKCDEKAQGSTDGIGGVRGKHALIIPAPAADADRYAPRCHKRSVTNASNSFPCHFIVACHSKRAPSSCLG